MNYHNTVKIELINIQGGSTWNIETSRGQLTKFTAFWCKLTPFRRFSNFPLWRQSDVEHVTEKVGILQTHEAVRGCIQGFWVAALVPKEIIDTLSQTLSCST